ncbi:SAM-dependent methyltransferase [Streptomyces aidingensis]|uniref:Methyltransferase domain-containing protein n=1 Tax=Streptomyces aidingensis TaxID=910347 RepID=A0A1I1UF55_9ACTN|nr:class I SAM-dependent methyltransferase [Streptomyces aidingensis]SFD69235.1 Methyltransferase domain-containing protein [Streptomyces aidingensis]
MSTHSHTPSPADSDDHGDAQDFWENHYAAREQIWSGRVNAPLAGFAAALPPGRALDLGCGEGGDAAHLAGLGWQVTAVDISSLALARTRARVEAAGVADRVTTERHDLSRSFPAGSFGLISAQYLQAPFEFSRPAIFRRAAAALTVGGVLFIVDHGAPPPWAKDHHAHHHFPGPREVYDGIGLDPAGYRAERLASPEREATGPDGVTGTLVDNVIAIRRLA